MSWSESQDGGELSVEEQKPDETRFVAISHVYATHNDLKLTKNYLANNLQ